VAERRDAPTEVVSLRFAASRPAIGYAGALNTDAKDFDLKDYDPKPFDFRIGDGGQT
jgi:hypothetical protein